LFRYFKYIFWLLVIIVLFEYREDQSGLAKERQTVAKENDELAKCKIFVQDAKFHSDQEMCHIFIEKNDDCKTFPEQKPECPPFLSSSDYAETKYYCSQTQVKTDNCKNLVAKKLWYADLMTYKKSPFLQSAFKLIGIDIDKSWDEIISSFDLKITIAIVAPGDTKKEFYQGVNLAIENINQNGGVLGRSLKSIEYAQHANVNESKEIAYEIIHDTSIVAVIGAQTSEKTKPVTKIYERGGILNLITSATNMDIISPDMQYTFRMIPNNNSMAEKTAEFCKKNGYKKIAIVTENSNYAEELSNAFYKSGIEKGIEIGYFKNFDKRRTDFVGIIGEMSERKADVIYFSGRYAAASKFLIQLRNMGTNTPVIGTESLDAQSFISLVGSVGEGFVIPSIYNEKLSSPENAEFLEIYEKKYGVNPNALAVQGYDAVKLLVMAINELKTTIPEEVASLGHFEKDWYGAGGKLSFDKKNGIKKDIYFKKLHLGEYEIIDN